ncbi:MAG TPA: regulatory protein RecX [Jiangellaceae bacterium]|nr:regulatory protein RecX [Jiangellaceae bacterium]
METDPDADPESVARTIALRKLTGAPQTRAQLATAMAKRSVPDQVAGDVLDRLTDAGLIDDAAYAQAWVQSRQAGRGLSRRALGQELRRKGVDQEVIDDALSLIDVGQEEAAARELVRRRLASTDGLPVQTRVRRLLGMLARKGYSPELAHTVVRAELDADELDHAEGS